MKLSNLTSTVAVLGCCVPASVASAENRVAPVSGNGAHQHPPLRNPPDDARALAAAPRGSVERPEHRVCLSGNHMDKHGVTNAQWNVYARSRGAGTKAGNGTRPVVESTLAEADMRRRPVSPAWIAASVGRAD